MQSIWENRMRQHNGILYDYDRRFKNTHKKESITYLSLIKTEIIKDERTKLFPIARIMKHQANNFRIF